MTVMTPIARERTWSELVVVRLLRRWASVRGNADAVLPNMVALGSELGATPHAAVALASVFQITEALLGRPLAGGRSCDARLGRDERATLLLLKQPDDVGTVATTRAVPHGLPGVLVWAVRAARIALADAELSLPGPLRRADRASCPFNASTA